MYWCRCSLGKRYSWDNEVHDRKDDALHPWPDLHGIKQRPYCARTGCSGISLVPFSVMDSYTIGVMNLSNKLFRMMEVSVTKILHIEVGIYSKDMLAKWRKLEKMVSLLQSWLYILSKTLTVLFTLPPRFCRKVCEVRFSSRFFIYHMMMTTNGSGDNSDFDYIKRAANRTALVSMRCRKWPACSVQEWMNYSFSTFCIVYKMRSWCYFVWSNW